MNDLSRDELALQEIPFNTAILDGLMEKAGLDALIVTSRHNVRYLLGGYSSQFFSHTEAAGISRYLPVIVYLKGAPEKAIFISNRIETHQLAHSPLWIQLSEERSWGATDAIEKAVAYLKARGLTNLRIGAELEFIPAAAAKGLAVLSTDGEVVDILKLLERLRARKTPKELMILREASEKIEASMVAALQACGEGSTKQQISDTLMMEETKRGLIFEYCLIAAGSSHNRAPSAQVWKHGDVLSIDSGGTLDGYIGDIARMGIVGTPDGELEDLLGVVESIQQGVMRLVRAGRIGGELSAEGDKLREASPHRNYLEFVAHGIGLIPHEAPRLTSKGPVPYPADAAGEPLEEGMVLSLETTMLHPRRGYIKLEDTVAVTAAGFEVFGTAARDWIVA
jgi:Xaa-Pro aminopeptidase